MPFLISGLLLLRSETFVFISGLFSSYQDFIFHIRNVIVDIRKAPSLHQQPLTGEEMRLPSGKMRLHGGKMRLPSGKMRLPSGKMRFLSCKMRLPSGRMMLPSGKVR